MENRKINILGTEYTICEKTEEQDCRLKKCDGYCDKTSKEIVIIKVTDDNCDLHNPKWYTDKLLRHEIVHAFLFESGMHECTNWDAKDSCHNEQLVDWFAIQSPKIYDVYLKLGLVNGTTVIIQQDCVEKLELARDVLKEQNDKLRGIINSFGREVPCE